MRRGLANAASVTTGSIDDSAVAAAVGHPLAGPDAAFGRGFGAMAPVDAEDAIAAFDRRMDGEPAATH